MNIPGGLNIANPRPPRFGWLLLLVGVPILLGGIGVMVYGIAQAISEANAIRDDAVVRGVVSDATGQTYSFESRDREFSVYLDFKGITNNSERFDDATGATVCTIVQPTGGDTVIRGSRQGTAATIGSLASVGGFDLAGSSARIACEYDRFRGRFRRPDEVPYVVTPHSTGEVARGVVLIISGVAIAVGGGWLAILGHLRRRKAARIRAGV